MAAAKSSWSLRSRRRQSPSVSRKRNEPSASDDSVSEVKSQLSERLESESPIKEDSPRTTRASRRLPAPESPEASTSKIQLHVDDDISFNISPDPVLTRSVKPRPKRGQRISFSESHEQNSSFGFQPVVNLSLLDNIETECQSNETCDDMSGNFVNVRVSPRKKSNNSSIKGSREIASMPKKNGGKQVVKCVSTEIEGPLQGSSAMPRKDSPRRSSPRSGRTMLRLTKSGVNIVSIGPSQADSQLDGTEQGVVHDAEGDSNQAETKGSIEVKSVGKTKNKQRRVTPSKRKVVKDDNEVANQVSEDQSQSSCSVINYPEAPTEKQNETQDYNSNTVTGHGDTITDTPIKSSAGAKLTITADVHSEFEEVTNTRKRGRRKRAKKPQVASVSEVEKAACESDLILMDAEKNSTPVELAKELVTSHQSEPSASAIVIVSDDSDEQPSSEAGRGQILNNMREDEAAIREPVTVNSDCLVPKKRSKSRSKGCRSKKAKTTKKSKARDAVPVEEAKFQGEDSLLDIRQCEKVGPTTRRSALSSAATGARESNSTVESAMEHRDPEVSSDENHPVTVNTKNVAIDECIEDLPLKSSKSSETVKELEVSENGVDRSMDHTISVDSDWAPGFGDSMEEPLDPLSASPVFSDEEVCEKEVAEVGSSKECEKKMAGVDSTIVCSVNLVRLCPDVLNKFKAIDPDSDSPEGCEQEPSFSSMENVMVEDMLGDSIMDIFSDNVPLSKWPATGDEHVVADAEAEGVQTIEESVGYEHCEEINYEDLAKSTTPTKGTKHKDKKSSKKKGRKDPDHSAYTVCSVKLVQDSEENVPASKNHVSITPNECPENDNSESDQEREKTSVHWDALHKAEGQDHTASTSEGHLETMTVASIVESKALNDDLEKQDGGISEVVKESITTASSKPAAEDTSKEKTESKTKSDSKSRHHSHHSHHSHSKSKKRKSHTDSTSTEHPRKSSKDHKRHRHHKDEGSKEKPSASVELSGDKKSSKTENSKSDHKSHKSEKDSKDATSSSSSSNPNAKPKAEFDLADFLFKQNQTKNQKVKKPVPSVPSLKKIGKISADKVTDVKISRFKSPLDKSTSQTQSSHFKIPFDKKASQTQSSEGRSSYSQQRKPIVRERPPMPVTTERPPMPVTTHSQPLAPPQKSLSSQTGRLPTPSQNQTPGFSMPYSEAKSFRHNPGFDASAHQEDEPMENPYFDTPYMNTNHHPQNRGFGLPTSRVSEISQNSMFGMRRPLPTCRVAEQAQNSMFNMQRPPVNSAFGGMGNPTFGFLSRPVNQSTPNRFGSSPHTMPQQRWTAPKVAPQESVPIFGQASPGQTSTPKKINVFGELERVNQPSEKFARFARILQSSFTSNNMSRAWPSAGENSETGGFGETGQFSPVPGSPKDAEDDNCLYTPTPIAQLKKAHAAARSTSRDPRLRGQVFTSPAFNIESESDSEVDPDVIYGLKGIPNRMGEQSAFSLGFYTERKGSREIDPGGTPPFEGQKDSPQKQSVQHEASAQELNKEDGTGEMEELDYADYSMESLDEADTSGFKEIEEDEDAEYDAEDADEDLGDADDCALQVDVPLSDEEDQELVGSKDATSPTTSPSRDPPVIEESDSNIQPSILNFLNGCVEEDGSGSPAAKDEFFDQEQGAVPDGATRTVQSPARGKEEDDPESQELRDEDEDEDEPGVAVPSDSEDSLDEDDMDPRRRRYLGKSDSLSEESSPKKNDATSVDIAESAPKRQDVPSAVLAEGSPQRKDVTSEEIAKISLERKDITSAEIAESSLKMKEVTSQEVIAEPVKVANTGGPKRTGTKPLEVAAKRPKEVATEPEEVAAKRRCMEKSISPLEKSISLVEITPKPVDATLKESERSLEDGDSPTELQTDQEVVQILSGAHTSTLHSTPHADVAPEYKSRLRTVAPVMRGTRSSENTESYYTSYRPNFPARTNSIEEFSSSFPMGSAVARAPSAGSDIADVPADLIARPNSALRNVSNWLSQVNAKFAANQSQPASSGLRELVKEASKRNDIQRIACLYKLVTIEEPQLEYGQLTAFASGLIQKSASLLPDFMERVIGLRETKTLAPEDLINICLIAKAHLDAYRRMKNYRASLELLKVIRNTLPYYKMRMKTLGSVTERAYMAVEVYLQLQQPVLSIVELLDECKWPKPQHNTSLDIINLRIRCLVKLWSMVVMQLSCLKSQEGSHEIDERKRMHVRALVQIFKTLFLTRDVDEIAHEYDPSLGQELRLSEMYNMILLGAVMVGEPVYLMKLCVCHCNHPQELPVNVDVACSVVHCLYHKYCSTRNFHFVRMAARIFPFAISPTSTYSFFLPPTEEGRGNILELPTTLAYWEIHVMLESYFYLMRNLAQSGDVYSCNLKLHLVSRGGQSVKDLRMLVIKVLTRGLALPVRVLLGGNSTASVRLCAHDIRAYICHLYRPNEVSLLGPCPKPSNRISKTIRNESF